MGHSTVTSPARGARRTPWFVAAVLVVVAVGVVGVVGLVLVSGRDESPAPALRFAEPLPADLVAFVNDSSLQTPEIFSGVETGSAVGENVGGPPPGPNDREARFVQLDGSEVVFRGRVSESSTPWDESAYDGPPVDIGVDGARLVETGAQVIAYPVDGRTRFVATNHAAMFGTPDPDVTLDQLATVARAFGTSAGLDSEQLHDAGVFVFNQLVGGELDESSVRPVATVRQGSTGTTLWRFPEPVSPEQLYAFAQMISRDLDASVPVGDTALQWDDPPLYVELLSPVDVVVSGAELPNLGERIDLAPADDLDAAFGSEISIPPRPGS